METTAKTCSACNKILHGRTDKKFCNDYCRNTFNNGLKSTSHNALVRSINHALLKNRRILESILLEETMAKASKEKLLHHGFHFKYITHNYTNKKGNVYFFCYEYGYLPLEHDWYLVVKQKQD